MTILSSKNIDVESFINNLKQLGSLERAASDKRYHKSEREHWGIIASIDDHLIKDLGKQLTEVELLYFAKGLWQSNFFDPMILAAKVLSLPKIKPSKELWDTIVVFLQDVDGWALEDTLAKAAHKCILADNKLLDEVESWTLSSNFWMRRAALVYTLPFAKPGLDPERMLQWASGYAGDSQWFIQKAIGWWLRVLGSHNPERVITFLNAHWPQLKSVAKKEATRKLSNVSLFFLTTTRVK